MMTRYLKEQSGRLLRLPRFQGRDRHMTHMQVWNEVVFPSLEAAFARLEDRTERMVRDEVARELARRDSFVQYHALDGESH